MELLASRSLGLALSSPRPSLQRVRNIQCRPTTERPREPHGAQPSRRALHYFDEEPATKTSAASAETPMAPGLPGSNPARRGYSKQTGSAATHRCREQTRE